MKKVQPGDRLTIPAETFNTFIDTARAFRAQQQNLGVEPWAKKRGHQRKKGDITPINGLARSLR